VRARSRAAAAAAAGFILLVGLGATDAWAGPRCFGRQATIVGTGRPDRLRGTGGVDVIAARGGDDRVRGLGGNDLLCGGGGADLLLGGGGRDRLAGQGGDDALAGQKGPSVLEGGNGSDFLMGGASKDRVEGGSGAVDILLGSHGNDRLAGGPGTDVVVGGSGDDLLDGGEGILDVASFFFSPAGVTADLTAGTATGEGTDSIVGVEDLEGSPFSDVLTGNAAENFFFPGGGDDQVNGADNFDVVFFVAAPGGITLDLSMGTAAGEGTDTLVGVEDAVGSTFNDGMTGSAESNQLVGLGGDDTLSGLDGDDLLDGDVGTDSADGGNHLVGDRCLNAETTANCESTTRGSGLGEARSRVPLPPPLTRLGRAVTAIVHDLTN
jgi:Ca2+-binding RTX toxin-like protein